MGDHSYPSGIVFGPSGQLALARTPLSPPDIGGPIAQERGYEEVEVPAALPTGQLAAAPTKAPKVTATNALNVVRSQLGYLEGRNNDNKYGIWYGWNHVAYCAIGITWTFAQASGLAQINGVRGHQWAYCPWFVQDWKRAGRWIDWRQTPQPGDIAFFNWHGTHDEAQHVGMVEYVDNVGGVPVPVTLEFNTTSGLGGNQSDGGGVFRRRRSTLYVIGYGRPEYAPQDPPTPIHPPKLKPLVVDGDWGRETTKHVQVWLRVSPTGTFDGVLRRRLQGAIGEQTDGVWGAETHKALQRFLHVTADGAWGPQTIKALQRFLNRTV